jgi:putative ABC transport system permease protein
LIRRHYSQAWGQSGLTILGLGLGVSVFISIHLAVGACLSSFKSTVQAVSGLAQWQIIQEGRGLEEGLFPVIKTHPAVQAAAPVVELQVPLQNHPGLVLWIMGVDLFNEAQVRTHAPSLTSLREPDFLSLILTPQAIVLSRDLARRLSLQPGSPLGVLINGRPQTLTVAALIDPEGPARALGGHFGVMDIAQAQEIMGKIGRLDRIDLVLNPEYSVAATIESLQKLLPPGASLLQPSDRQAGTERMVRSYQLNLLALSFIAVLVSMVLMYNVTALSVVRRRKDLGILRSLGMLPNQILYLILWESAGYGLVGGLLGIGGGYLLARVILGTISQTISDLYVLVGVTEIPFVLPEMALFLVGAVGVALVSAYVPARQASRLQPREIIAQGPGFFSSPQSRKGSFFWAGSVLLILTGVLLFIPPWQGLPLGGLLATLTLILGFSLWLSPVTHRILSLISPGPASRGKRRKVRPLGYLYFEYALDKMAVSMAALMTAIAMLISVSILINSFRQTVDQWIDQSISGDLLVGPVFPSNQGDSQFLEPEVIKGIETLSGIKDIYYYRGLPTASEGQPFRLWAGNLAVIKRYSRLAFTAGNPEEIYRQVLTQEAVILSEVLANRLKARSGDSITLLTALGPHSFRIAGIFYDYRTEGGGVWIDRAVFLKWWQDERINGVRLYLKEPGRLSQVRESLLKQFSDRYDLVVISHRELREQILRIFDQTFQVTYALEAIAILVAFLGIIHTSSILILFREKELGILKALGALPGQVRMMILTETGLMGFFSFFWGGWAGTLLSLILILVINKQSFGWTIQLHWSFGVYGQTLILILISSILAGLVPASIALRTKMEQQIREE